MSVSNAEAANPESLARLGRLFWSRKLAEWQI